MPDSRTYLRQLAGRALITLIISYVLAIGGTFNGILFVPVQWASLFFLVIGVIVWQIVVWLRPLRLPLTPLDSALLLWGLAYALSYTAHPSGRTQIGLWYAGLYLGVWLLLADIRRRGLPGRWITDGALIASLPLMLLAIIQISAWFPAWFALDEVRVAFTPPRPPSLLGNPNAFGGTLALLLPFGVIRIRWSQRKPDRVLWAIWTLVALVLLYFTYSRGAWLAAAAAFAVMGGLILHRDQHLAPSAWIILWRSRSRREKWLFTGGMMIVLVVILALGIITLSAFDTPRRETNSRLDFYEIALKTLVRHPLTGTGPFSFGLILLKEHSIPPDQPHAHAHNLILNVAAELGLPGLIALAITLFLIVRQNWRTLQQETASAAWAHTAACAAALTAFGVHGLVDMPMMFPAVMLLMLGILAAGIVAPQTDETRPQWLPAVFYRIGPLALWGIILAAGLWSAQHYTDYVRGERLIAGGQFVRGAEMLRQVAVDQPQFALYQAEYGYACGLAAYAGDLDYVQSGIDAYQRALDQESVHADWWANLAALYWQAGEPESAIAAMNQAVQVAPDSPDLWLNLGIYFEAAGRKDQAEAAYIHVLQADSYWGHTSFWNDTPLRQEIIANYPVEPTAYQQAEMLWQAGQPTDAVDLLIATIDHDPTQPGPYFRIARLYIAGGAFDQAESYLEAARVLVHADQDRAWIALIEGELALAQGDRSAWSTYHRTARHLLWPDSTGYPLNYGNDIANLQFLRVRVKGVLLPQLTILGPDPILTNLLRQ